MATASSVLSDDVISVYEKRSGKQNDVKQCELTMSCEISGNTMTKNILQKNCYCNL